MAASQPTAPVGEAGAAHARVALVDVAVAVVVLADRRSPGRRCWGRRRIRSRCAGTLSRSRKPGLAGGHPAGALVAGGAGVGEAAGLAAGAAVGDVGAAGRSPDRRCRRSRCPGRRRSRWPLLVSAALAAVLGHAVQIDEAGGAGVEAAAPGRAQRGGVGEAAGDAAAAAVGGIGLQLEALVDHAVAVVVLLVADLGRRRAGRGRASPGMPSGRWTRSGSAMASGTSTMSGAAASPARDGEAARLAAERQQRRQRPPAGHARSTRRSRTAAPGAAGAAAAGPAATAARPDRARPSACAGAAPTTQAQPPPRRHLARDRALGLPVDAAPGRPGPPGSWSPGRGRPRSRPWPGTQTCAGRQLMLAQGSAAQLPDVRVADTGPRGRTGRRSDRPRRRRRGRPRRRRSRRPRSRPRRRRRGRTCRRCSVWPAQGLGTQCSPRQTIAPIAPGAAPPQPRTRQLVHSPFSQRVPPGQVTPSQRSTQPRLGSQRKPGWQGARTHSAKRHRPSRHRRSAGQRVARRARSGPRTRRRRSPGPAGQVALVVDLAVAVVVLAVAHLGGRAHARPRRRSGRRPAGGSATADVGARAGTRRGWACPAAARAPGRGRAG